MEHVIADIEMSSEIQSTTEIVGEWLRNLKDGELTSITIEKFWKEWVPRIYSPPLNENCLSWNFDETLATKILYNPLEQFICKGDPQIVLQDLSQMNKPPSVCGRVFKMGEPTYSCRECGTDKTCVLCVDCFKNSEHRFHKYKMGTSTGGGCCDCGDIEAWKKDYLCSIHVVGTTQNTNEKNVLPDDMRERTKLVFETVLCYAYKYINSDTILPANESGDKSFDTDTYCTILYNDEVHTFEQVISTLTRVLKCTNRHAIEYVTNIDREGRAIVKCSYFKVCSELKQDIEKYTSRHGNKALKVIVSHSYVLAHQIFAMKLLAWLQTFLGHGEGFRRVFAEVVLKEYRLEPCIVKGILEKDSKLWKSARTLWHRILISGMLLEYDTKKALATIFTKNYGQIMKDFIKDDHDHSFSVSSLSVQLFTVKTLAHHLIANNDVLFILLNTLISECSHKCNKMGKLEFERTPSGHAFKRALYTLYDFRYLLTSLPDTWTDNLRSTFLHGVTKMLQLLAMMQGMDAVTRQVGQHMEYEPEWESGFNLHIKLSHCISLVLMWCATDKVVLVKTYRAVLVKLEENPCYDPSESGEVRELADHSTACLHYDVASKPVSVHLPLTRFLAGLHLHLEKYNLHFDSPEFQVNKPTPVQIIEPVLRTQVMIAQVHSGMWRRNGYALLNTLFFYHNVKCRTEMLDRDITVLQMGASLIESNEFLIHVLNKFNLIGWAMPGFEDNSIKSPEEDSIRQTTNMVEELLHLLIVIIGERYMPGISNVSVEDRIKKEIIQHLCIKPLPHSELIKTIPEDFSHDTAPDEVIQELAEFKKPAQGSGTGVYELKPQYYDEYNVFFYHYTREDLSKSEENQRTRRRNAGELECCPPPKLLKLTESFSMLVNLLQCDVMLHIMQTVLQRCYNLRARSFSEAQLQKILHLIGYALNEEQSKNYPFFKFVENASKFKIYQALESLLNCPRVDAHKALLKWTILKYKEVASIEQKDDDNDVKGEVESASEQKVNSEKERRARLAAERRQKLMAQMTAMQNNFIKDNAELFEETNMESGSARNSTCDTTMDVAEPINVRTVALGRNQSPRVVVEQQYTCILCQEEEKITPTGPAMVLAAFVQQATVLCQNRSIEALLEPSNHDPLYLHANLGPAPHTSTCGHVMHSECWRKYYDNVLHRENRRPYRLRHPSSFDVDKQEFLCPLCECLSNTVLPLIPSISVMQPNTVKLDVSFDVWFHHLLSFLSNTERVCHGDFKCNTEECKNIHCEACISATNGSSCTPDTSPDCEANCILQPHQIFYTCAMDKVAKTSTDLSENFVKLFPTNKVFLSESLKSIIQVFTQVTYTRGLNVNPHPTDNRLAPIAWKTLAYTIHSIEVLLRLSNKPLLGQLSSRQRDCIENFVRVVGLLGYTLNMSVAIRSHALNLLTMLLEHSDEGPSILNWDSFGFLVSVTFSLPSLSCKHSQQTPAPSGGTLDHHTFRLIFVSHIVKILITMDVDSLDSSMEVDNDEEIKEILNIVQKLGKYRDGISTHSIWQHVQYACLPFLRCCVLFYHYLTDVAAPLALLENRGDTFANMCEYLDVPQTPRELFSSVEILGAIDKWIHHSEVQNYLEGKSNLQFLKEPRVLNHLIELPTDYSELINTVSTFVCPNSEEDSRNPTMCLVCGEILCSQSYCCQTEVNKVHVGACNHHAHKCGAGVGIFLRVRECEIMFLASPTRGCFVTPPYLDDYGETDQGLRRGNPLKLCMNRYKKLQTLWLSHSLHEEIARSIETSSQVIATQWNLL